MSPVILSLILFFSLIIVKCLIWGFLVEPRKIVRTRYHLNDKDLASITAGKTIVFFSDLHASRFYNLKRVARVIDAIREEQPDLILFGGDLISEGTPLRQTSFRQGLIEQLARLEAPLGKWACFGNHDVETETNRQYVGEVLHEAGFTILENSARTLGDFNLIGLAETRHHVTDLPQALRALPDDRRNLPAVILMHQPDPLALSDVPPADTRMRQGKLIKAAESDPELNRSEFIPATLKQLILSGHTHRGQITWFGHPIYRVGHGKKFVYGSYRLDSDRRLIVSGGLGTVHLHARFFSPPEIVLITSD